MEKRVIQQTIGRIGKALVKLVADIQAVAIEIVLHAVAHGDVTLADELIAAVGKGVRRNSLAAWFELNGPFVLKDGKFGLNKDKAKTMRATPEAQLREQLLSRKWEEAKPEPKLVSVFDCTQELDRFFARIDKLAAEGKVELKNKATLDAIRKQAAKIHAIETLKGMKALEDEEMRAMYGDVLPGKATLAAMHLIQQ